MNLNVRALAFAGAMFAMALAGPPAQAVTATLIDTISINSGMFTIDEYSGSFSANSQSFSGSYTVHNNSASYWIYAFAVSNPDALTASPGPATTFSNWLATTGQLQLGDGSGLSDVNAYYSADADASVLTDTHIKPGFLDVSHYIAPGGSSDLFFFNSTAASIAGVKVVNIDGADFGFSSPTATPLPAALPLFASGAGFIGLLARRRKRLKARQLRKEI